MSTSMYSEQLLLILCGSEQFMVNTESTSIDD